ncbi:MAG TPA: ATP-binding protein [Myxococcota bacterium]|nr:ATP-binding protein [Myxococcota bacterium]
MSEIVDQRRIGLQLAVVRLLAVPVALLHVATTEFPAGYRPWAFATCALLAAGGAVLLVLERRSLEEGARSRLAAAAVALDTAVVAALLVLYSFVDGQPTWALFFVPTLEAALRFGLVGGLVTPLVTAPLLVAAEAWRAEHFEPDEFRAGPVGVRVALAIVLGGFVGQLAGALRDTVDRAAARAQESERMRDELGRRLDLLEAANRCARALASSLRPDEAFDAFTRELRGVIPTDRLLVLRLEEDAARVVACSGLGADRFPPGSTHPIPGTVFERVLDGRTLYRRDLSDAAYEEEGELLALGLRSRVVVPLQVGARTIGLFSVSRREPAAFSAEEVELTSLLGRLIASSVQNIRAYEVERATAEELRRLSTLRADFVSMVSHELRSPMAAVVGAARTLNTRDSELDATQRRAMLAIIAREAERLASLVADVLDTSKLEAGTLGYSFEELDIGELVHEAVQAAAAGQAPVRLEARADGALPPVRGDRDRLRQVFANLVDNAVKYSPPGGEVRVSASARGSVVAVDVTDHGPGIAPEEHQLIFEKFGRANAAAPAKPGTGLGLYIARSIAEAHGGSLSVRSAPGRGATFTLTLPVA